LLDIQNQIIYLGVTGDRVVVEEVVVTGDTVVVLEEGFLNKLEMNFLCALTLSCANVCSLVNIFGLLVVVVEVGKFIGSSDSSEDSSDESSSGFMMISDDLANVMSCSIHGRHCLHLGGGEDTVSADIFHVLSKRPSMLYALVV